MTDTAHTYAWDANGRPVTIDSVTLTYDALGRMVEQDKSGVFSEISYAPSGSKLAIMNGQSLTRAFVPLSGGSVAVYNSSGVAYYRHPDWLGSSRFASTPARAMYSDGAYAPFGENYAQTGSTDLSFTGMNQDTVSNLFDFSAREYNGIHGRWPSPDPLGLGAAALQAPQSLNRYAYVLNNPMTNTDPTGLLCRVNIACPFSMLGYGDQGPTYNEDPTDFSLNASLTLGAQTGQDAAAANAAMLEQFFSNSTQLFADLNADAPVPTSLQPLFAFEVPPSGFASYPLYAGNVYGGGAGIAYQVLDQFGNPMETDQMTPVENLFQVFSNPVTIAAGSYFGPVGPSLTTNQFGAYIDSPVGSIANVPFFSVIQQSVFMNYQGNGYLVGTFTWTVNASSPGTTSISGSNGVNLSF